MKYEVRMNGNYMNCYGTYSEACEERDRLQRMYPQATVEVTER
jgi:hypothetical protein